MSQSRPPGPWTRRVWVQWSLSVVAVLGVVAVWAEPLYREAGGCKNLEAVGAFAGDRHRFADNIAHCRPTDLSALHTHLAVGALLAALYTAVLFFVCSFWWSRAWLSKTARAASSIRWLALAAGALDVTENILLATGISLPVAGQLPKLAPWAEVVLPVVAWMKVLAFATAWVASLATLLATYSRRRLVTEASMGSDPYSGRPVSGFGICCSGGGIRAASISLGALGSLERHQLHMQRRADGSVDHAVGPATGRDGLLYQADLLASVSGGGYAAGAWRVASAAPSPTHAGNDAPADVFRHVWPAGVTGDPRLYSTIPPLEADSLVAEGPPTLFRHLQQRRAFLSTGRGGFRAALLTTLAFLALHLAIIGVVVIGIAWPLGRLCETWFVYGNLQLTRGYLHNVHGQASFAVARRMWSVPALFAGIGVACLLPSMLMWNTVRRKAITGAAVAAFAAALITGAILVGMPWMLDTVYPVLRDHPSIGAITTSLSAGGAVGIALSAVRTLLKPKLIYLGGVLLFIAGALFGLYVAGNAAANEGPFGLRGGLREPLGWLLFVLVGALGYTALCPRWWSLHTLYRNRLRSAFVTSRSPDDAPRFMRHRRIVVDAEDKPLLHPNGSPVEEMDSERLWPVRQRFERRLDEFQGAVKPVHLVCCSVARSQARATGVKALSLVMSPDTIEFYDVDYAPNGLRTTTYAAPTTQWIQALGSNAARQAEGTVSAAISVSGAALAPAMGRFNMGSTNALLATLNLRLGSWFPNPRYVPTSGNGVRFPWVRLSYMFKELFGRYDLSDHHLYVTDGGHRENLGLVELLRRRCRTIVCVDASGDTPGTYTTLRQAADLARIEVGADIDLRPLFAQLEQPIVHSGPSERIVAADPAGDDAIYIQPPRITTGPALRPAAAHVVLPVTYRHPDGSTSAGTIIHLAPVMFVDLSDDLVAFGFEDPLFPHYSTGDQFLSEHQFRNLVLFGSEATTAALADSEVRDALAEALAPPPDERSSASGSADTDTRDRVGVA